MAIEDPMVPVSRKALLIGINYTGTAERLNGSHRDVQQLQRLLLKHGYKKENITVMLDIDSEKDGGLLLPTQANILRELENLTRGAQRGDRLLFHFSGHSGQTEQLPDDPETELDHKDEILLPCDHSDTKFIRDNELHSRLVNPLPPGSHLTAIFDTCHSGTLLDLPHRKCNTRAFFHSLKTNSPDSSSSHSTPHLEGTETTPRDSVFPGTPLRRSPDHLSDHHGPKPGRTMSHHKQKTVLFNECSGYQCEMSLDERPNVISFSASKDHQSALEDPQGTSLTIMLIKSLEKDPRPQLDILFPEIGRQIHKITRAFLDARRQLNLSPEVHEKQPIRRWRKLVKQQPQVCSMNPSHPDDCLDILDPRVGVNF